MITNRGAKSIIYFLFFTCLVIEAIGQTPFIRNYTPKEYKSGIINWQAIQEKSGMMYFANMDGVLQFDGLKWQLHYLPKKEAVFSIALHPNKDIYVGGARQFGFMRRDENGLLRFTSLTDKLTTKQLAKLKTIYDIFFIGDEIFFQGQQITFIYKNGSFKTLDIFWKHFYRLNNKLFIKKNKKLLEYQGSGKMTVTSFLESFPVESLDGIISIAPQKYLVWNNQNKFFTYDGSTQQTKEQPRLDILKDTRIFDVKLLFDGRIAVATSDQGLFIFNVQLELIYKIDKSNGLQHNKVYHIYEDQQHNLWAPLYQGISHISISSPIAQLNNKELSGGFITTLTQYKNRLYVGTTNGLYHRDQPLGEFNLVKNTEGDNWNVYVFDDTMYLAHGTGVFTVKQGMANKITSLRYVHSLTKLKSSANTFIAGTYDTGIWLLTQQQSQWVKTKIKGFDQETRYILEDKQGHIWIAHYNKGIYRLTLNTNKDSVTTLKFYDQASGLPSNKNNRIYRLKSGEIIATTTQGFYRYDTQTDQFKADAQLNLPFKNTMCIYTFAEDTKGNIFFWAGQKNLSQEKAGVLTKQSDGSYVLNNKVFNKIALSTQGLRVDVDAPILVKSPQQVLIGNTDNIIAFNPRKANNTTTDYRLIIDKISSRDSIIFQYGAVKKAIRLPYVSHDIQFFFAAMSFENIEKNQYSYQLVGYNKEWSKWQSTPTAIFTSLPEGNYLFKVKAKNIYNKESSTATFEFKILPPWHRTWWAYTVYGLLSLVVIVCIVRINSWRLRKQKKVLELTVQQRTQEITAQNEELKQNQEEILTQRNYIEDQNQKLLTKNTQIQQSLKSALVIQKAILPFDSRLQKIFSDHFILYKPKDTVSGDFYWIEQIENKTVVVVADCTGHGVPGAFMSLISYNLLDKIILLEECLVPSEILQHLHEQIIRLLKQDQVKNHSGLDAAIIILEKDESNFHLNYAGARRPLFYRDATNPTKIAKIKGTRKSIGGIQNDTVQFEKHELTFPQGSILYTGSDGFEDQNNKERKKLGREKLLSLLNEVAHLPLYRQKLILEEHLQKHMEGTTQRDDILWMGIKL